MANGERQQGLCYARADGANPGHGRHEDAPQPGTRGPGVPPSAWLPKPGQNGAEKQINPKQINPHAAVKGNRAVRERKGLRGHKGFGPSQQPARCRRDTHQPVPAYKPPTPKQSPQQTENITGNRGVFVLQAFTIKCHLVNSG